MFVKDTWQQVLICVHVGVVLASTYDVCCRVDQCDVKSSKKRPLFLVWTNPDPMAQCLSSDFQIIFKSGDGQCIVLFAFSTYMLLSERTRYCGACVCVCVCQSVDNTMTCRYGNYMDFPLYTLNKKAQLSLTNPRDACEKFARFT